MTMNDTWGYKRTIITGSRTDKLIYTDVAAKGGNYLLNVGPTSEGLIPTESVKRLEKWVIG